jgi:hypothetical protein
VVYDIITIIITGIVAMILSIIFHGEIFHLDDVLLGIIAGALIDISYKLNNLYKVIGKK